MNEASLVMIHHSIIFIKFSKTIFDLIKMWKVLSTYQQHSLTGEVYKSAFQELSQDSFHLQVCHIIWKTEYLLRKYLGTDWIFSFFCPHWLSSQSSLFTLSSLPSRVESPWITKEVWGEYKTLGNTTGNLCLESETVMFKLRYGRWKLVIYTQIP